MSPTLPRITNLWQSESTPNLAFVELLVPGGEGGRWRYAVCVYGATGFVSEVKGI